LAKRCELAKEAREQLLHEVGEKKKRVCFFFVRSERCRASPLFVDASLEKKTQSFPRLAFHPVCRLVPVSAGLSRAPPSHAPLHRALRRGGWPEVRRDRIFFSIVDGKGSTLPTDQQLFEATIPRRPGARFARASLFELDGISFEYRWVIENASLLEKGEESEQTEGGKMPTHGTRFAVLFSFPRP
jgi:hypothetical protein